MTKLRLLSEASALPQLQPTPPPRTVSLVNDQHAAPRLLQYRRRPLLALAQRRAHKVSGHLDHDVALAEQAEVAEDAAVDACDSGLACGRGGGEGGKGWRALLAWVSGVEPACASPCDCSLFDLGVRQRLAACGCGGLRREAQVTCSLPEGSLPVPGLPRKTRFRQTSFSGRAASSSSALVLRRAETDAFCLREVEAAPGRQSRLQAGATARRGGRSSQRRRCRRANNTAAQRLRPAVRARRPGGHKRTR